MKKLGIYLTTFFLFYFIFFIQFNSSPAFAESDEYYVEGWVFVDVDGDGHYNYLIDTPLVGEEILFRDLKTGLPGKTYTQDGSNLITIVRGTSSPKTFDLFPILGLSYVISYGPDEYTKGYYSINRDYPWNKGIDENNNTWLRHDNTSGTYPQRIKTLFIRPQDCVGPICGNQDFTSPPGGIDYVSVHGKDQGKKAGTNSIVVNFMLKRPPGPFKITNASCAGPKSIRIEWEKAAYVTPIGNNSSGYKVYRLGKITPVATITDNSLSVIDNDPAIIPGVTYQYFVEAWNDNGNAKTTTPLASATTDACTTLSINSLRVEQAAIVKDLTAPFGKSGLQSDDPTKPLNVKGKNFYNPMKITLSANFATEYYVAFYNQTLGLLSTKSSFIADVQNRLIPNPKNGFLLAYRKSGTACPPILPQPTDLNPYVVCDGSFVYEAATNKWINLSAYIVDGYQIGSEFPLVTALYYARITSPSPTSAEWRVGMWAPFGNKNVYTGVLVRNSVGKIDHQADITPIQ